MAASDASIPGSTHSARVLLADLNNPVHTQAIEGLINAYAASDMGLGAPLPATTLEALIPGLRAHTGCRVFLAQVDDRFVGLAVCFEAFSTFRGRPLLNIHDLFVSVEYRRRGVARALLNAAAAHAANRGCCKLTLEVREDNASALRLYTGSGFQAGSGKDGEAAQYLFLERALG
jgi:ribosomal protein S18 acetylase RimI-like enzyme